MWGGGVTGRFRISRRWENIIPRGALLKCIYANGVKIHSVIYHVPDVSKAGFNETKWTMKAVS